MYLSSTVWSPPVVSCPGSWVVLVLSNISEHNCACTCTHARTYLHICAPSREQYTTIVDTLLPVWLKY